MVTITFERNELESSNLVYMSNIRMSWVSLKMGDLDLFSRLQDFFFFSFFHTLNCHNNFWKRNELEPSNLVHKWVRFRIPPIHMTHKNPERTPLNGYPLSMCVLAEALSHCTRSSLHPCGLNNFWMQCARTLEFGIQMHFKIVSAKFEHGWPWPIFKVTGIIFCFFTPLWSQYLLKEMS